MIGLLSLCVFSMAPLVIDHEQSSIDGEFEQSIFMPGTLIGNWNEKTNPEGTSTLPGYWGGSGNNLIACEFTPVLGGPYQSPVMGDLNIELDTASEILTVDNLLITAFDGTPATFPVTLGLLFETFRTVQPDSLFPGGVPVDIPLGDGEITLMKFEQHELVTASLEPLGGGEWMYFLAVPVNVTVEAIVMDTETGPLLSQGILEIEGTIEIVNERYQMIGEVILDSDETVEGPPISFENVPFDVSTVIPQGETAHLLVSAVAKSATMMNSAYLHIIARGDVNQQGDVDGDGVVGVNDLLALIAVWGQCASCNEDINNDGFVNVTDLLIVIANWTP